MLVHTVVDDVADAFLDLLDGLYEEIDELEGQVDQLSGAAVRMRLAELRHELLHARRTMSATRAAVRRIADGRVDTGGATLFPASVESEFIDTYETLVRATEELDVARDLLGGVRDFHQAKITEGQNDVAKKLTVIASLVLVPSLIVGFYGQNFGERVRRRVLEPRRLGRPDRGDDGPPGGALPLAPLDLTSTSSRLRRQLPPPGTETPAGRTSRPEPYRPASPPTVGATLERWAWRLAPVWTALGALVHQRLLPRPSVAPGGRGSDGRVRDRIVGRSLGRAARSRGTTRPLRRAPEALAGAGGHRRVGRALPGGGLRRRRGRAHVRARRAPARPCGRPGRGRRPRHQRRRRRLVAARPRRRTRARGGRGRHARPRGRARATGVVALGALGAWPARSPSQSACWPSPCSPLTLRPTSRTGRVRAGARRPWRSARWPSSRWRRRGLVLASDARRVGGLACPTPTRPRTACGG